MAGGYTLYDPFATYLQGQSISALEVDAGSAGQALIEALGEVEPGPEHGGGSLKSAITTFQTDCSGARNSCVNAVGQLGETTSAGAQAGMQTNNEGTHVANDITALARDVTGSVSQAPSL